MYRVLNVRRIRDTKKAPKVINLRTLCKLLGCNFFQQIMILMLDLYISPAENQRLFLHVTIPEHISKTFHHRYVACIVHRIILVMPTGTDTKFFTLWFLRIRFHKTQSLISSIGSVSFNEICISPDKLERY